MPNLGFQELIVIFLIVVVMFGASRLPQLGRGLGEGIRNFKSGLKADDEPPAVEGSNDETAESA